MSPTPHWTVGAAKWVAVGALGSASLIGLIWSMWHERPPLTTPASVGPGPTGETTPAMGAWPLAAGGQNGEAGAVNAGPARHPGPHPVAAVGDSPETSRRAHSALPAQTISINTASAAELELLPGIGPALAARIVADRAANGPFRSVEELARVRGIGPRTVERVRPYVRVD